MVLHRNFVCCR